MNENLKNVDGESNLEVRKRMLSFLEYILLNHKEQRIAAVSHGGAIKFLLKNWCIYDYESDNFIYDNKILCSNEIESPSTFKLIFNNIDLVSIEKIRV